MPPHSHLPGDTIYIRATVVEAGTDYCQVLVDDGKCLSITQWVPASECARREDLAIKLKPPRRANPRHIER